MSEQPQTTHETVGTREPYSKPEVTMVGRVKDLTLGNFSVGNDGSNTRKNPQSDRRLKCNVRRVGTHPLGIGLYLFDYRAPGADGAAPGRQFGVMADEVLAVRPSAVSLGADGFMRVDYGAVGIA